MRRQISHKNLPVSDRDFASAIEAAKADALTRLVPDVAYLQQRAGPPPPPNQVGVIGENCVLDCNHFVNAGGPFHGTGLWAVGKYVDCLICIPSNVWKGSVKEGIDKCIADTGVAPLVCFTKLELRPPPFAFSYVSNVVPGDYAGLAVYVTREVKLMGVEAALAHFKQTGSMPARSTADDLRRCIDEEKKSRSG